MTEQLGGALGVALALFVAVIVILWVLLPFIVFGTNKRLDRMIELLEEQNGVLKQTHAELTAFARGTHPTEGSTPVARHIQFRP